MTAPDHNYETAGDRASLAREAGVGKLSFISVLAGVLVAYGAFAVLAALVGAAATAIGLTNDLSRNDWARLGTGIASLAAMLIGALVGGMLGERWHSKLARTAPSTTVRTAAEQAVSTRRSGAPSCAHE